MSVAKTKEYLEELRHLDDEIDTKEDIKQQMWGRLTSVKSSQIKEISVQGGEPETMEDRIIKYWEYAEELNEMVDELHERKQQAIREINQLECGLERTILLERYIKNSSWEEIADKMYYSRVHIARLHDKALKEFTQLKASCY